MSSLGASHGATSSSQAIGGEIALHAVSSFYSHTSSTRKKSWQTQQHHQQQASSHITPSRRNASFSSSRRNRLSIDAEDPAAFSRAGTNHSDFHGSSTSTPAKWWKVHFFRGMIQDIRRRAPYYWSDWTDAWDYRVVPATVYMYFAKYVRAMIELIGKSILFDLHYTDIACYSILPALAFSLDMFEKTHQSYGVNEVLLASVLGSVVFSVAAAQPLVIVGVTGKSQHHEK